jgi:transposase
VRLYAFCEQLPQATGNTLKLPEAKKGFVLLLRRRVVERSFSWLSRLRRRSRDFERMLEVLAGLHFIVFTLLMMPKVAMLAASEKSS